ncbi:unnamed protein product [Eretmochelys imbricata]
MKLQIVAAILLVTILSPKRSSAQQVGAQGSLGVGASVDVPDVETPFEEAVSVFPQSPAGERLPQVFPQHPARESFPRWFNGAMICGTKNYELLTQTLAKPDWLTSMMTPAITLPVLLPHNSSTNQMLTENHESY